MIYTHNVCMGESPFLLKLKQFLTLYSLICTCTLHEWVLRFNFSHAKCGNGTKESNSIRRAYMYINENMVRHDGFMRFFLFFSCCLLKYHCRGLRIEMRWVCCGSIVYLCLFKEQGLSSDLDP